ncbi:hypothetical protein RDI58_019757 [Solanum bulbocastanum]|uniref:Uncharacterized protein n=1 Tax=Solanum bulbocastanum TaxID=147425 RepID=A0AAN8Y7X2_SOLBU
MDKDHFSLTEMKSYAKDSRASHPEDGINRTLNKGDGDDNDEENSDSLDFEEEYLDGVPDEDDSEIDEELRAFKENPTQEKRNQVAKPKERIKKSSKNQEVELGEAGIDKEFEDILKNKAAKYIGKLIGNEEFIGSSDEPIEDSDEELDAVASTSSDKGSIEIDEFGDSNGDSLRETSSTISNLGNNGDETQENKMNLSECEATESITISSDENKKITKVEDKDETYRKQVKKQRHINMCHLISQHILSDAVSKLGNEQLDEINNNKTLAKMNTDNSP